MTTTRSHAHSFDRHRWLLCSFKRELSFEQTLRLWEVLWTDHLGTSFHLFVALAIIEAHRDVIIRYLREFDEVSSAPVHRLKGWLTVLSAVKQVLKYITQLSQTLDVDAIMADAEVLFVTFRQVVEASDRQKAAAAEANDPEKDGLRRRKVVIGKRRAAEEDGAAYPPASAQAKGKGREEDVEKEVVEVAVEATVPEVDEELRTLLS